MAACQLTIKLDDNRPRSGGEPVTGTVSVKTEKAVTCKALIVRTMWSTHGRGNVETGEVAQQTVFSGSWNAGQEYSYPFQLSTPTWPPTYYGTYLNVSHFVAAQAKLSWALDPKEQVEYRVVVTDAPADLKPTTAPPKKMSFVAGLVLGLIALAITMAFLPLLILLLVVVAPIALIVYLFKVVLPKRITGPVDCQLATTKVHGGEEIRANLTFTPARNSAINGIEWTLQCVEECASGSGSNRKVHHNQLFQETVRASDRLDLKAGQKQSFDFSFRLPETAAPSLKFSDNKVLWSLKSRIDIPSWPDWTKSLDVIVVPSATVRLRAADDEDEEDWDQPVGQGETRDRPPIVAALPPATNKAIADDAWLRQVISQLHQSQHDSEQLAIVLTAVADFEFPIEVTIEDAIDTPEFSDETQYDLWDEAHWYSAYCPSQNADLAIAWLASPPAEVKPGRTWAGTASVIGYEKETQRILMTVA